MKTAPKFHLYVLDEGQSAGLPATGLETEPLTDPAKVEEPALILLRPGQKVPDRLAPIAVELPADASPAAARELVRVAMENVVLKRQVMQLEDEADRRHRQFRELNRIGIALSAEKDIARLQAFILTTMRQLTHADGASLWLKMEEDGVPKLFLASSQNHSLDKNTYQAFKVPVDDRTVVGYTVSMGTSQIYEDAYNPPPGKPVGGKSFDSQFGYRTKSMLTVPMRNYNNEVVGAVQLINAKRRFETRLTVDNVVTEVVSFQPDDLEMIESIASQAAVALDNKNLLDSIQALFDGFVQASVTAIEQRDPSTAGHSGRVEGLTASLARAVNEIDTGKYRGVHLTDDQLKELRYACLLHDFGKVGVREHILIKAKKLVPGQLEVIQARFDFIERSVQVKYATEKLEAMKAGRNGSDLQEIDHRLEQELEQLNRWVRSIAAANEPTVMPEDKASVLEFLSQQTYQDMSGHPHPMLEPQEFRFLSIRKGTLDPQERLEMESHVTHSFHFLTKIPWTPVMRGIPEIAYGHHEKLDGSGYPRRLTGDQIPLQARMMTISDIYDALTAQDRPYKRAVPSSTALDILHEEAGQGKLDKDLLDVFVIKKIYQPAGGR
ncbi:MAG: GAF domain-containing protein [Chloroflexi bacterium]|nr:MAG: GAF domain-containing protein [Chloroflexota bacterium]TMF75941.1 MAG: GAF domain-containing protein [Chloroflexota bacterium]TMG42492.1 MAG: GAF domain-containing protein [Chloroflexota bacterium]